MLHFYLGVRAVEGRRVTPYPMVAKVSVEWRVRVLARGGGGGDAGITDWRELLLEKVRSWSLRPFRKKKYIFFFFF